MSAVLRLRHALAQVGLFIVRPVSAEALTRAGLLQRLKGPLPEVQGAVVVGDGGGRFFEGFRCTGDAAGPDPLDRYTARVLRAAVADALAGETHEVLFPFLAASPPLPLGRLGEASGLPPPGPLGLQVHPTFGPWWAYRAVVLLTSPVVDEQPLDPPCDGCPAPCAAACPAGAVLTAGFSLNACVEQRRSANTCDEGCLARLACVRGPEHRYPEPQMRFHTAASLVHIRRR